MKKLHDILTGLIGNAKVVTLTVCVGVTCAVATNTLLAVGCFELPAWQSYSEAENCPSQPCEITGSFPATSCMSTVPIPFECNCGQLSVYATWTYVASCVQQNGVWKCGPYRLVWGGSGVGTTCWPGICGA